MGDGDASASEVVAGGLDLGKGKGKGKATGTVTEMEMEKGAFGVAERAEMRSFGTGEGPIMSAEERLKPCTVGSESGGSVRRRRPETEGGIGREGGGVGCWCGRGGVEGR